MIFIIVGSQRFQFDRLLIEVDRLIDEGYLRGREVFAQVGHSNYLPKNFSYIQFVDTERYLDLINKSELIITHGGASAIISSLKRKKKVIGVPRLVEFNEHVDNHQMEIIEQFKQGNLIYGIDDVSQLKEAIGAVKMHSFNELAFGNQKIVDVIQEDLKNYEQRIKRGIISKLRRFFGGA